MLTINSEELPDKHSSFPEGLRALALVWALGLSATSCGENQTVSSVPNGVAPRISDPDYLRWKDTIITIESSHALGEYLKIDRRQTGVRSSQDLTFATEFTYDVALDSINRARKLSQFARSAQELLASRELPIENSALDAALQASISLEYDRSYRNWSDAQDFSDKTDYDCEEIVVSYVATLLSAQAQRLEVGKTASIAIVTGMFYDPSYPGKGGGHVWVKFSEGANHCYIDPTLDLDRGRITQIPLNDARFIAIAEQPIHLEKSLGKLKLIVESPIILRLPKASPR